MAQPVGRNPPLPPHFVASSVLRDRCFVEVQRQAQLQNSPVDRSSTADKSGERPVLPPNYVSLRMLRDMRLKETEEKEKERERGRAKPSNDLAGVTLDCTSLKLLQEGHLKEEKLKEEEEEKGTIKEEFKNCSHLPLDFVSLRQVKEQQSRKEEEREKEDEKVKGNNREKTQEEEKAKGKNYPILPPDYVSLKQLKELRLQEKEQIEAEKATHESRRPQIKVREKADGLRQIEVEINKKAPNMVRNHQYKNPYKHDCAESSWVWVPTAGTCANTGTSSAGAMFPPQNDGASHEAVMIMSHQNEDAGMNPKNKWKTKTKKKKQSRKAISAKEKDKPEKSPEDPMEVTGIKIGKELNTSSRSMEAVTLSQSEDNTVKKGNEENANLTKSSIKSITVGMEVKRFNRAQSARFKRHNGRGKGKGREVNLSEQSHSLVPLSKMMEGSDGIEGVIGSQIEKDKEQKGKGNAEVALFRNENTVKKGNEENANLIESSSKSITVNAGFHGAQLLQSKRQNGGGKGKGKEVNLSEQSYNVIPLSKVMKGSDGLEEVIGSKIENDKEQKGKGKTVNVPELCDQKLSNEEEKGTRGAGEVIRSKIQSNKENWKGKNVKFPELSKWGGRAGDNWKKSNLAASSRASGHQRTGAFRGRPAEHPGGAAGLMWVPKKCS